MNELEKKVSEMIINDELENGWDRSEQVYDLTNLSGLSITIIPSDAKKINEIEKIEVAEDVEGTIFWKYKRK